MIFFVAQSNNIITINSFILHISQRLKLRGKTPLPKAGGNTSLPLPPAPLFSQHLMMARYSYVPSKNCYH